MRPFQLLFEARWRALWIVASCAAVLGAAFACTARTDIHESDEAKGKPCLSCHTAAYNAAKNPVHLDKLPQTCQDCHGTKAWSPSTVTDHHWFPLVNKHVGVNCAACHTKGYKLGDTPTDCVGCHRKNYESAQDPNAGGFTSHFLNGVDQYPTDCTLCHSDMGFLPSPWKHLVELPSSGVLPDEETKDGGLVGRHFNAPCAGCHTGTPPKFKGTPNDSDCVRCHKKDADNPVPATKPNHAAFPVTCANCHLMSGWKQGPPLLGLHPVAPRDGGIPFPLEPAAGKHSGILCRDCHRLEKGPAFGGANADCVNCHQGGVDHHRTPAIDAIHLDGGTAAAYVAAQGSSTTNYCLGCHDRGQHL
jgi:hypothetical protein